MVVDYRKLNENLVSDSYPLPRTDVLFASLLGHCYYAALDLRNGYYNIPLDKESSKRSAFCTPGGLFEWTRVPFGLKTAPAHFQRSMALVLGDLRSQGCLTYLDDVLVMGKTPKEFLDRLSKVIRRFKEFNFILNMEKSNFGSKEIDYLGFHFSENGKEITTERQEAIAKIPLPLKKKDLRRFLGIINYVKDFVANLSVEAAPLYEMLSQKKKFLEWNQSRKKAFAKIKLLINNATSLSLYDPEAPLMLFTDASILGCGAVLKQFKEGKWFPIQYISKKFSAVQRRWATIEQEAYGIVYAVNTLRYYLLDKHFVINTDHRNLLYLRKNPSAKVIRWQIFLSQFDFTIKHVPGKENVEADVLSRGLDLPVVPAVVVRSRGRKIRRDKEQTQNAGTQKKEKLV
ncbi:hypothetical protein ADUPG1_000727, partial [Aduncisulcus paluster]